MCIESESSRKDYVKTAISAAIISNDNFQNKCDIIFIILPLKT